jgi:Predicted membrane protein (DUF2157)
MLKTEIFKTLIEKEIISSDLATKIELEENSKPFSIHWELRSLLYLGISIFTGGLSILIYKNINTIGHNVLIVLIAILCSLCFFYAYKHAGIFNWAKTEPAGKLDDYALLCGCILFLTLEGYLQYEYNLFGNRYGMAALLPAILFFYLAYRFDHRGVLSMAITALASWVGVTIAPVKLWETNKLNTQSLVITAILLGVFLIAVGWFSDKRNLKKHFSFSYFLFGANLAFVASLSGLFSFDFKYIYFLTILVLAYLSIIYARENKSYIFLLMGVIYSYIALTYAFFKIVSSDLDFFVYQFYFIFTAGAVIYFLINIKKIIKQ